MIQICAKCGEKVVCPSCDTHKVMNYPHLYIKALLDECKSQNSLMINHNEEYTRRRMSNWSPEEYLHLSESIQEITLYIEQLNQEIVKTVKQMETK